MRRPLTDTLAVLALLASAPAILAAQQVQGRNERTFSISERLTSGGAVRIFSPTGDITVTEGSGS
ncbi:MAG TPA: hypothetical protein VFV33_08560, partial [Gemmatimonadaceae bacterium]|nr:hypothetical protein [Gemmatimonadaceae bacterium]